MTLQLDARQRAMLEEMGIKLFWPDAPAAAAAPQPEAVASRADAAPVRLPAAPARTEARSEPRREPVAAQAASPASGLDWDTLQQAVAEWAAGRRRKAVFGVGDARASWLCVGDPPVEEEERQGQPFVGDPGRLLDNMLAAVGASRQRGAYLTNVMKCRLPDDRSQEAEELAQSMAFLQRQVELLQPRVILAMGRTAVQGLLQTAEPVGKLRGRLHRFDGVPVVVTYHPAYLLRNLPDKARAWADLCLARAVVEGTA